MNTKTPAYLCEKGNIVKLILFTALFALLFINIFQPFNSRQWYPDISEFKYFFFSSLIILTGMLVVVVSRMIMLKFTRMRLLTYPQYFGWIAAEILAMSLFFALFSKFIPAGNAQRDFMQIFHQSAVNTSLVLLLPYSVLWLYFSWRDKNNLLEKMNLMEQMSVNSKKHLLKFSDEKGELKLSVFIDNLLYIESAENYATIHYINKSKVSHFLIRNSLKWMEENLITDTPLVRCHRSYIINLDKIKVMKKTKDGIFVEFDTINIPDIPVTKTYYAKVMEKFSAYSV
jgi:hypothetical protein